MAKVIEVRDGGPGGEVVARISPYAKNVKERLDAAICDLCKSGKGHVEEKDDPDFVDMVSRF